MDIEGQAPSTSRTSWIWGGSKYSGVACMAISSAAYSVMGLLVKLLTVKGFPSSQIVIARCGIVALLSGISLWRMRHPLLGSPSVRRLVVARAVVGFVALSTYFFSIQALPLRDATILNFTMPVFTAILAACLIGEGWGLFEATGTFCSLLGVLLVTQVESLPTGRQEEWSLHAGVAMAIVGAFTGALSYIIVRVVGKRGEPPLVCVFAFAALSTPLAMLAAIFQGFKAPRVLETLELLCVGLTAYAAQVFLTRGLQLEAAARATSVQYVKVVCTYVLGVVFLREKPSLLGVIGALLISMSAGFISYGGTSTGVKRV